MKLKEILEIKGSKLTLSPNKILIPVLALDNTEAGAHEFNQYYTEILEIGKKWKTIRKIKDECPTEEIKMERNPNRV